MAHYYVVRQKLDKTGAEDKVRYYGVPVTCGRVSTKSWLIWLPIVAR